MVTLISDEVEIKTKNKTKEKQEPNTTIKKSIL